MQEEFYISTKKKQELVDITSKVDSIIKKSKVKTGLCNIFTTHSTAAIIINENYDPNICTDLLNALSKLVPSGIWLHDRIDGNADAHIKSAILGPSETIPIKNNQLELGRWQSIMMVELDGPRSDRRIIATIIGDRNKVSSTSKTDKSKAFVVQKIQSNASERIARSQLTEFSRN